MSIAVDRSFTVDLACHYLLQVPDSPNERTPLIVSLHGFGGNGESMLRVTNRVSVSQPIIAALQGPYQFFLSVKAREVGYGWITGERSSESIRLHHQMVLQVIKEVSREFRIPPERRLLMGFSQSVALNYRFAAAYPDSIRGVVALCGGLPGDWEDSAAHSITAAVLHIATREDEYYPPSVTQLYPERLRRHASDVEFHLVDGGHSVPESTKVILAPWVERILSSSNGR